MKVSIIIPVYNVENYIEECLKSLINQTYDNIEILFINDGSKDKSAEIIKEYMKKNKNIKLINQKNEGQSSARNKGLKNATGDYIMFVDSDDFIDKTMVEKLITPFFKNKDIEITFCSYYFYYNDINIKESERLNIKSNNIKKEYILSPPGPCCKIFKKSLLKNFRFPEGIIYEDYATIPILIAKAKKIKYIEEPLYYYRQNSNSTTGKMAYSSKKLDIICASQILLDTMLEEAKAYFEEIEFLIIKHLLFFGGLRFVRYPKPKEKLQLIKTFIDNNKINFEQNKYFKDLPKSQQKVIRNMYKTNFMYGYWFLIKKKLTK